MRGDEEQIGGFDLIVKGNAVKPDPNIKYSSIRLMFSECSYSV